MHTNGSVYYLGFDDGTITNIDGFEITFRDGAKALKRYLL